MSHQPKQNDTEKVNRRYLKHKYSPSYQRKTGLDGEVISVIFTRYPDETLNTALRLILGLPTKPTKYWKQAEVNYLKKHYQESAYETIAIYLGRSIAAVRCKATELSLKRCKKLRITPSGAYNRTDLMQIFHFSGKYLDGLLDNGTLHWVKYKNSIIAKREDIIEFLRECPFKYRHDLIETGWRCYVPKFLWEWIPITDAAKQVNWGGQKIRNAIKLGIIPVKNSNGGSLPTAYVRLDDVKRVIDKPMPRIYDNPYKVAFGWLSKNRVFTPPYTDESISHYVIKNDEGEWFRACKPNNYEGMVLNNYMMSRGNSIRFVKGYPHCKVCLQILKTHQKQIAKRYFNSKGE